MVTYGFVLPARDTGLGMTVHYLVMILLGCIDQGTEDRAPAHIGVLPQLLWVALHREDEMAVGALDGLDHTVGRVPHHPQAGAEFLDRLVVERIDPKGRRFEQSRQARIMPRSWRWPIQASQAAAKASAFAPSRSSIMQW